MSNGWHVNCAAELRQNAVIEMYENVIASLFVIV